MRPYVTSNVTLAMVPRPRFRSLCAEHVSERCRQASLGTPTGPSRKNAEPAPPPLGVTRHPAARSPRSARAQPLHYPPRPQARAPIVNEAEARVVRRIFALYDEGLGYAAIAERPNTEGVPEPRTRRRAGAG
jgi:hypothetical protein